MNKYFRCILWTHLLGTALIARGTPADETTVPVKFSGGHETDPRDHGRPVVLVAAGLGVTADVFRNAFSNVRPAKNGKPSGEEARRNKEVLMKALGPHGITNERLDEVSNYYRYQPQKGKLWPTTAAKAHAVVEDGKVKRIVVDEGGAGYSSPPTAMVEGLESVKLKVNLSFGKDLKKNGAVETIAVE
jgi:hypothetical protein